MWKTNEYLGSMRIPPYSIGAMSVSLLLGCVTRSVCACLEGGDEAPAHNLVRGTEQWLRDCSCLNRTFLWVGAQKRVGNVEMSLVQINRTSLMT